MITKIKFKISKVLPSGWKNVEFQANRFLLKEVFAKNEMGKSEWIAYNFTYIFIDQDEKSFNDRQNHETVE